MSLQTIQLNGKQFVLIPAACYARKKEIIDNIVAETSVENDEYVPFVLEEFVKNPIALARIKAGLTQKQLAKIMGCAQSNISQLENVVSCSPEALLKVTRALEKHLSNKSEQG